jgi:hypothetical protein
MQHASSNTRKKVQTWFFDALWPFDIFVNNDNLVPGMTTEKYQKGCYCTYIQGISLGWFFGLMHLVGHQHLKLTCRIISSFSF